MLSVAGRTGCLFVAQYPKKRLLACTQQHGQQGIEKDMRDFFDTVVAREAAHRIYRWNLLFSYATADLAQEYPEGWQRIVDNLLSTHQYSPAIIFDLHSNKQFSRSGVLLSSPQYTRLL